MSKGGTESKRNKNKSTRNKWGPLRAHRMNWKVRFRELTGWRPKNNEERWKTFTKSPMETSQKHYGSASAWIFFTETIFLTNFKWISDTRRVERICSALFPLFIGEKREVVAAQLALASWVASTKRHRLLLEHPGRPKWAWLLFAHPYLLITPILPFFADSFSVTLWNFTDYVTILVLFP